jgi:hypothetical protein
VLSILLFTTIYIVSCKCWFRHLELIHNNRANEPDTHNKRIALIIRIEKIKKLIRNNIRLSFFIAILLIELFIIYKYMVGQWSLDKTVQLCASNICWILALFFLSIIIRVCVEVYLIIINSFHKKSLKLLYLPDEMLKSEEKEKLIKLHNSSSDLLEYNFLTVSSWNKVRFRDDKDIVLLEVGEDGSKLFYLSENLKADKEVVLAAVKQNANALQYASVNLRADKEVVLAALKRNSFQQFTDYFNQRRGQASIKNGDLLQYVSENLKDDKHVILAAVRSNGDALKYASERLRAHKQVVLAAVKQDIKAIQYASNDLKEDEDIKAIVLGLSKNNSNL